MSILSSGGGHDCVCVCILSYGDGEDCMDVFHHMVVVVTICVISHMVTGLLRKG